MSKIEIQSDTVSARTVKSKRDGKEYTFYTQEAYFHDESSSYPVRCSLPVSGASAGYRPGWYRLPGNAVYVDRYGNLSLARRFDLVSDEA